MYGGLSTICVELMGASPDHLGADPIGTLAQTFQQQTEAAIRLLPFMMPATKEYIEALFVAVGSSPVVAIRACHSLIDACFTPTYNHRMRNSLLAFVLIA